MGNITRPLEVIESEINFYKSQTASGIIEIGKRLIEAKEQLQHGEWGRWLEEKVEFGERTAQRFMQVANEIQNTSALTDLPKSKVFALLDMPSDQREDFIKSNPVDDMTTRQLQEAIQEKKRLEKQLEAEKNKPPVEVAPADYNLIKSRLDIKDKEIENMKRQMKILELKANVNEKDAESYNRLKKDVETLTLEKEDLRRMISTTTELSGLAAETKIFFETKLAPVKYSRAIQEACEDEIVRQNLEEILDTFKSWIAEMSSYLYPKQYGSNVIEMEVSDNE
jgi:hypothetical protein